MSDDKARVSELLQAAQTQDPRAAEDLVPVVYDELRRLARSLLRKVPPGNTLQTTALVHEAYLRLVGDADPGWNHRGHFFGAAARAMRLILVDQARRKAAVKHGGGVRRVDFEHVDVAITPPVPGVLELDEALARMEAVDPRPVQLLMLRCFAGLTREEAAAAMGVSVRTVDRDWRYAIARLRQELRDDVVPGIEGA
jgi:RNA polymerase sigma factor (TIGR02999 family)